MHKVDLSIIIVNYNARDFLLECLESIKKHVSKHWFYEVIVIDNASTDGSVKEISNFQFPISNFKIIENKENVGFSKANNQGVKEAKGRYLLFLNPDTEIREKSLEEMVAFMDEHKDAGAATCYLALKNGKLDDASHRGFPTPWNAFCYFFGIAKIFPKSMLFNGYNLAWKDLDKIHEIDALAGAFMIVRREAGEDVGWWDEDYFFYGEDLDFCYKLKEKGWKIYFVPTVSVLHHKGVTGGIREESKHVTTADRETRIRATNARFDAMKIFYRKHYSKKYPGITTWFVSQAVQFKRSSTLKSIK